MRTIAIANHKGGVGKSTLCHHLGASLAADHGQRVLMVDLDPQGSLTGACGAAGASPHIADVLGGDRAGKTQLSEILIELSPNLWLAPSDLSLAPAELGMIARMSRELILRRALAPVAGKFDVVLLDCPPSLGILTLNALGASNAVLIPTQPQAVDLRGLALFLETLDGIKRDLTPGLEIIGIVATFYDDRLITHKNAIEAMQGADWPVLDVKIGRSVRVAEAAGAAQTVYTFEPNNPQAVNYRNLSEEINQWLKTSESSKKTH